MASHCDQLSEKDGWKRKQGRERPRRKERRAVGGVGWGIISGPDSATEWLDDFGVVSSLLGPHFPHLKIGQKFLPRLSHSPVEHTQSHSDRAC